MMHALVAPSPPERISVFDEIAARYSEAITSFTESDALGASHWEMGEDGRLREDIRFRPTPWGRWTLSRAVLANDVLFSTFVREQSSELVLTEALDELVEVVRRPCVFCPGDDRFVLEGGVLRLAAKHLTHHPLLEDDVTDLEKYRTHLPLHSLKAAAASEPAGEWGPRAQEEVIETIGWVRLSIPGRTQLNDRMFVAQIEGHSMDDGRSGLVDGGLAVFELWPAGTRQFLNVLVRGSFSDPETGSYAVKKYVADTRDEEGRHHEVKLISLNPDKIRYPEILLPVEDDDDITVVAKVITGLSTDDFARKPKTPRRPGRRDLASDDSIEKIHARLSESVDRFFDGEAAESEEPEATPESWNNQLVCMDADEGGLHFEIGPLIGLWKFVKKLSVNRADGNDALVLASNARLRPVRVAVPPGSGPWEWTAVGFEDDEDVDLAALNQSGLPTDAPTAFRVDADGVGRRISGTSLSPGQHYRLLCPKALFAPLADQLPSEPAGKEWRLIDIELPRAVSWDLSRAFETLGFTVGEPQPRLRWAVAIPDAWRSNLRGEPYACFGEDSPVVLSVTNYGGKIDGDARLFVHGPAGPQTLDLPVGDKALIEIDGLGAGRYYCSLFHRRTRVQPAHLPFEVATEVIDAPAAAWTVTVDGHETQAEPGCAVVVCRGDLGGAQSFEGATLEGPPGWPVRVLWRELHPEYLDSFSLNEEGALSFAGPQSLTQERRQRRRHGDLLLDLGELGLAILEHERRPSLVGARAGLSGRLSDGRVKALQQQLGAYAQWFPQWHAPICTVLGYEAEWVEPTQELPPPVHAAVARLLVTERGRAGIERTCGRILVMLDSLDEKPDDEVLDWVDGVCRQHKVRTAILTTGIKWSEHRLNQRIPHVIWDLPAIINDDAKFVAFLRDVAEGV